MFTFGILYNSSSELYAKFPAMDEGRSLKVETLRPRPDRGRLECPGHSTEYTVSPSSPSRQHYQTGHSLVGLTESFGIDLRMSALGRISKEAACPDWLTYQTRPIRPACLDPLAWRCSSYGTSAQVQVRLTEQAASMIRIGSHVRDPYSLDDPPIHAVPHFLIHLHRPRIVTSHKQVDKPCVHAISPSSLPTWSHSCWIAGVCAVALGRW